MIRIAAPARAAAFATAVGLAGAAGCSDDFPKIFIDGGGDPCNGQETFIDGGVGACAVPDPLTSQALLLPGEALRDDQGTTLVTAPLCASPHRLSVQLYPGRGTLAAPLAVGTHDLALEPFDFASCGACVRLLADVDAHGAPTTTYMATTGELSIVSLGASGEVPVVVGLSNVTFVEATIDPVSFATTAVNPGCTTFVTGVTVQAPVRDLP